MSNQTLVETRGRKRVKDVASKLLHSLRAFFSTIKDPPQDERAWKKINSGIIFWQKLRSIFFEYWVLSWSDIYLAIQYGYTKQTLTPVDTS